MNHLTVIDEAAEAFWRITVLLESVNEDGPHDDSVRDAAVIAFTMATKLRPAIPPFSAGGKRKVVRRAG